MAAEGFSKMDIGTANAVAGALGAMDAGTAKTLLSGVVAGGGDKLDADCLLSQDGFVVFAGFGPQLYIS